MFTCTVVGCMRSLLADEDIQIGDKTKESNYLTSQGCSDAREASTCLLTDSTVNRDLLGSVIPNEITDLNRSAGGTVFCCCFLPKTTAEQAKINWSAVHDFTKIEKGEGQLRYFSRVGKIVRVLASLGCDEIGHGRKPSNQRGPHPRLLKLNNVPLCGEKVLVDHISREY